MYLTDPIADMLTRIRNASAAKHATVDIPASNMKKAIAQILVDEGYIDNIAVTPDARRHGVASALLDVYCRFGAVNLAFLTLEVRASNQAARGLYEKYGFQQAGLRPGYYQHPREDAVIMTRYFNGQEGEQP